MLPSHQLVGGFQGHGAPVQGGGGDGERKANHHLHMSWTNSQFPANLLTPDNVMDYFMTPNNPFYDNTSLNEILRMQGRSALGIDSMEGTQYKLILAMEPLFVIRKVVKTRSKSRPQNLEESPLANFYIINGTIYKSPDLASIINARVLSALCNIQTSFAEARQYSRYHPSRGYWWEFEKPGIAIGPKRRASRAQSAKEDEPSTSGSELKRDKSGTEKESKSKKTPAPQDVRTTLFQRTRVDSLLGLLSEHYPLISPDDAEDKEPGRPETSGRQADSNNGGTSGFGGVKREFGGPQEDRAAPPTKRIKIEDS